MEKTLEKSEDKIQKICNALRKETLDPARLEAEKIIEDAKSRAESIVSDARKQAEKMIASAKDVIDQERNVFHSSLEQAGKQTLEEIRQAVERKLFHDELQGVVEKHTSDPDVIAKIIASLLKAVEKEGISTDLSAVIPESASTEQVNRLLGENILKKLKEKSVTIGDFAGGARVKLIDKKMTIDLSDSALRELLAKYVRKDFRKLLFKD